MLNTESIFRDEFFTPHPEITEYKKNLLSLSSDTFLIKYEKNFLFMLIKRRMATFKPGVYKFYLKDKRRELRVEEWIELEKNVLRPYRVASIKNAVLEGEAIQFVWE